MWYMSVIPASGRWRQEDYCKFESSLDWEARSCLKKTKTESREGGRGREKREREEREEGREYQQ